MKDVEQITSAESHATQDRTDEPTVLDWVKSLLRIPASRVWAVFRVIAFIVKGDGSLREFGRLFFQFVSEFQGRPISVPAEERETLVAAQVGDAQIAAAEPATEVRAVAGITVSRLRLPVALFLALVAQFDIEVARESTGINIILYLIAAVLIAWSVLAGDFQIEPLPMKRRRAKSLAFRPIFFLLAIVFSALAFLTSSKNRFTLTNVSFWVAGLLSLLIALWEGEFPLTGVINRLWSRISKPSFKITLDSWAIVITIGFGISLYFRFADLATVPAEMVSDHAEKLLDVVDILNGKYPIFFPRNTGREALQFYMGAAAAKWFGLGISHMTLKIGTVLAGVITLPYIYLLGKETGQKEVGLAAMALAGIGYWPNVISRVGLRFPLYPLFVAPAMFYLVRGIRRKSLNDFLFCGLAVGIGLNGYSPARVIPIVVTMGVALYLIHREAKGKRWAVMTWLIAAGMVALVVFLPLLRVALDRPDEILFRTITRMGGSERAIEGSPWMIFLANMWDGLRMFGWDDGMVWVNSIPHRPAFDWVTAALFHLGVIMLLVRYIKDRHWLDLFLLLSIPVLQLPSTLAIAFPAENPATNRAAGSFVPAFVIAGMALAALPALARTQWKQRKQIVYTGVLVLLLFTISAGANYNLVFDEYANLFRRSAWNTSEAGAIIRTFAESIGSFETSHVVAYPHWMDTRLVGIQAGRPTVDYAIWADDFEILLIEPRPMLFILNPRDEDSLAKLQNLFPTGTRTLKRSDYEGKDLVIYFVPPDVNRVDLPAPTEKSDDDS